MIAEVGGMGKEEKLDAQRVGSGSAELDTDATHGSGVESEGMGEGC